MTASSDDESPTRECPACHAEVAARAFCVNCGVELKAVAVGVAPSRLAIVLRPRVFAAAPHERVEWPLVSSALFPRLTQVTRMPFRHALILLLAMLVGFSLLKLLAPLVIVTAFGISLLYLVYLSQSGAVRDIPPAALAVSATFAIASSVAWWLWTSELVAKAYGVPLAVGAQLTSALGIGTLITLAGAVLMLLPAVLVRLLRFSGVDSLDGFVIGALGALFFSAAGTITWFAPQFIAGLIDNYGPWRLFEEAYLYGLVDPLTAAAAGGSIGLALWFRPNRAPIPGLDRYTRLTLWFLVAVTTGSYMGVYVVDASEFSRWTEIGINTVLTGISVLAVRTSVQTALLHEASSAGRPGPCADCGKPGPGLAFCPECGGATAAAPHQTRLGLGT